MIGAVSSRLSWIYSLRSAAIVLSQTEATATLIQSSLIQNSP
jgi:hypothetical protein